MPLATETGPRPDAACTLPHTEVAKPVATGKTTPQ